MLLPGAVRQLRPQGFDAAVVFRPDHWWGAMLAALARIPARLGYDTPETTPWLTQALHLPHEHAAASNLRLAGALVGMPAPSSAAEAPLSFIIGPKDRRQAGELLTMVGVRRPFVIIHPGAGHVSSSGSQRNGGRWPNVWGRRALASSSPEAPRKQN